MTDELNMKSRSGRNGWQNTVVKVSEEGAKFRSYRDGRLINLTPELSVQAWPRALHRRVRETPAIRAPPGGAVPDARRLRADDMVTWQAQKAFGADIIVPLDELPPYHISRQRRASTSSVPSRSDGSLIALQRCWFPYSTAEVLVLS